MEDEDHHSDYLIECVGLAHRISSALIVFFSFKEGRLRAESTRGVPLNNKVIESRFTLF